MSEMDFLADLLSAVIMLFASVVLIIIAKKVYPKDKKSVIELNFSAGALTASIASIVVTIFHIPYLIGSTVTYPYWNYGSYLYYIFMALTLTFMISCGIGIKLGTKKTKFGYYYLITILSITIAYLSPDLVWIVDVSQANMEMSFLGVLLIFGMLLLGLIISILIFFSIYRETRNYGSKMMSIGIFIVTIGALAGGLGDFIGGDISYLLDPLSFLGVFVGIVVVYIGFREK